MFLLYIVLKIIVVVLVNEIFHTKMYLVN